MNPVVQEEITGCAIASAAVIAGISYKEAKKIANSIGIYAEDSKLWTETTYIRNLLSKLGVETTNKERPFNGWESLPNVALLSTKWHMEKGKPYWHWVVFIRKETEMYVFDSKKTLKTNKRTDFGRIKPKWFIEVKLC
ncbi:MAG: hypothetical protein ABFS32_16040 [Bacteroidota bacterium]